MKNNIGNDSQNETRAVRKPQRIIRSASGGIGTPSSELARAHLINFFWTRHTTPHVLSSMTRPSPPPTLIARWALETVGPPFKAITSHDAAITTIAIPMPRTHGL